MLEPQALAERVRDHIALTAPASRHLGMVFGAVAPGQSEVSMRIEPHMLNGLGNCHGGMIATLADSAFAVACNNRNVATVASSFSIDFLLPGHLGDTLTARAVERNQGQRLGLYDVEVTNQNGDLIAIFRGHAYSLKGRTALPE